MAKHTKQILIEQVQWMTEALGHVPKKSDFEAYPTTYSCTTVDRYFGSWNAFLKVAGVKDDAEYRQKLTDQELFKQVQALAKELGHTPSVSDYKSCKYTAGMTTISRRFSSWNTFIEAAGLRPNKAGREISIADEELIRQVQQLAADLGRVPSVVQYDTCEYTSSANAAKRRFGSWSEFLVAAGMVPDNRGRKRISKGANDNAES